MKKFLIVIIFAQLSLYGQNSSWKGDQYFEDFHFKEAAALYEKHISSAATIEAVTLERLADSYFNLNDYRNAYKWYDKLYSLKHGEIKESTLIEYVQSARASRNYHQADK